MLYICSRLLFLLALVQVLYCYCRCQSTCTGPHPHLLQCSTWCPRPTGNIGMNQTQQQFCALCLLSLCPHLGHGWLTLWPGVLYVLVPHMIKSMTACSALPCSALLCTYLSLLVGVWVDEWECGLRSRGSMVLTILEQGESFAVYIYSILLVLYRIVSYHIVSYREISVLWNIVQYSTVQH
jgi:hypothetical protein